MKNPEPYSLSFAIYKNILRPELSSPTSIRITRIYHKRDGLEEKEDNFDFDLDAAVENRWEKLKVRNQEEPSREIQFTTSQIFSCQLTNITQKEIHSQQEDNSQTQGEQRWWWRTTVGSSHRRRWEGWFWMGQKTGVGFPKPSSSMDRCHWLGSSSTSFSTG